MDFEVEVEFELLLLLEIQFFRYDLTCFTLAIVSSKFLNMAYFPCSYIFHYLE